MPGYAMGVKEEDYKILEKEARRKRCGTRDLIKESFTRNIESLRGGVSRRRPR